MRVRPGSPASGVRAACAVGLAATLALTGTSAPAWGGPADDGAPGRQQPATCPVALLPAPARGDAAVRALGADVIAVAARNGTNPRDLARHLRADRSLWVDECGDLLFIDELPSELEPAAASTEGSGWPALVDASEAFTLHSRPGSARVILLDFDGQAISGTKWTDANGQAEWTAPAFSTDGDPSTFSDSERAVIIDVWRRVAQDYAPFDVDVTTQDPGDDAITRADEFDDEFGTRVLISPDEAQEGCDCGGRAYVDVFDLPSNHAEYQPAWVYPQALGNAPKFIADAASHEAGHNFGLSHDGTRNDPYFQGAEGWGPIMGAPYGQPVTQWSDGGYPRANNQEDDLVIIGDGGAPLLADDVTQAQVVALPGAASGLINGTGDVDDFTVQAPDGTLEVSAEPLWPGPNLDVSLTVRDSSGGVVATSAPVHDSADVRGSLGASLSVLVSAGTYSVVVDGSGNGIPGSAGELWSHLPSFLG